MTLISVDAIYDFLSTRTTYDVDFLLKDKSEYQIYQIYSRINEALKKYPIDIITYLNNHPGVQPRYTLEQLRDMSYNQLSELRERFKIRKGKKVTNTTIQTKTFQDAIDVIRDTKANDLCANIITPYCQHELILAMSEVNEMYGEDWDNQFLEEQGIILEDAIEHHEKILDSEDIRLDKIDKIMSSNLTIKGQKPTFEDLYVYNSIQLDKIYKLVKKPKS